VAQFYRMSPESRSTTLKSFDLWALNREKCKIHNLQQPFDVSNYNLLFCIFLPLITGKLAICIVKQSFSCLHSMSKDGQNMLPMHATLKVSVRPTFERSPKSFQADHFAFPTKSNAPGLGELHFPILPYG